MVSRTFGIDWIRLVPCTNQPLTGYGFPLRVASRMPLVVTSSSNGNRPAATSTFFGRSGKSGVG